MEQTQPPRPTRQRLSAEEVRRKYGTIAILLLVWEVWCVRDGWFHPRYEYIGFSRFMAYVCFLPLIFCGMMALSAIHSISVRKQLRQQAEIDALRRDNQ